MSEQHPDHNENNVPSGDSLSLCGKPRQLLLAERKQRAAAYRDRIQEAHLELNTVTEKIAVDSQKSLKTVQSDLGFMEITHRQALNAWNTFNKKKFQEAKSHSQGMPFYILKGECRTDIS